MTDLLFLRDAYVSSFTATVVEARGEAVALDRTAFYATGGGQPNDRGAPPGRRAVDVRKEADLVRHTLDGAPPAVVGGDVDWGKAITGGNMEPLAARMDFEVVDA